MGLRFIDRCRANTKYYTDYIIEKNIKKIKKGIIMASEQGYDICRYYFNDLKYVSQLISYFQKEGFDITYYEGAGYFLISWKEH